MLKTSRYWVKVLDLSVPGSPPSTNSLYPQAKFHGRRFMSLRGRLYKEKVEHIMNEVWKGPPLAGKLMYHIDLYFPDCKVRDNANYEKCLVDSLKGVVFVDDSLFMVTTIEKHLDRVNPRAVMSVFEYRLPDSVIVEGPSKAISKFKLPIDFKFSRACTNCHVYESVAFEDAEIDIGQRNYCRNYMDRGIEHRCPMRPVKNIRIGKTPRQN